MKIDYYIKGIPVNPVNRSEIYLEINHDQEAIINQPAPHVGINNLYFAREDVKLIMDLLSQSPGITEGIPFDIVMTERGQSQTIRMYIDLMDGLQRSRDGIQATVKMQQSLDWLDSKVEAFTHESMYYETGVKPFVIDGVTYPDYKTFFDQRCIYVPYVISSIPNWQDAFMALFAITYIGNELYKVLKSIIQWTQPLPGFGLVIGIVQLVMEIAFAVLLIITLLSLLKQLIDCLIQPVKYHAAMLVTDLLKVTCAKLGMDFSSSIWNAYPYNQIAYMPEKFAPLESGSSGLNILGFIASGFGKYGYDSPSSAQHGYFNGTGGDFLRFAKSICNGKIIIQDGTDTLQMERRDYFPTGNPYQLPDIRIDWNEYNTNELNATTILTFAKDFNDKNTVDKYKGTILQATHQQVTVANSSLVCLKGLREIQIPAARGINKTKLTFIEKAVKDLEKVWDFVENIAEFAIDVALFQVNNVLIPLLNVLIAAWNLMLKVIKAIIKVINTIIDVVNSLSGGSINHIDDFTDDIDLNYIQPITFNGFNSIDEHFFDDRINAMLLENDMIEVPKLLFVDTSRTEFTSQRISYLHTDNLNVINAENIWNKFYSIDAFVGATNNRRTKISPALNDPADKNRVIVSLRDFKNLVSNPKFKDNFGEDVEADSVQWYIEQNGAAEFTYRKKGWLKDPQNINIVKRSEEININLKIQITVPNGQ